MQQLSQRIIRTIIMWFGLLLLIVVFFPYIKEYVFEGPEKEFAFKEVVIAAIGFLLAVGAKYWDKISNSLSNAIDKKLNK